MAMSDEIREQRKTLKGQGIKAYLKYFADYYLLATVGTVIGIGLVIYLIVTFVTAKPTAIGAYFLNTYVEQADLTDQIAEDFAQYAGIDTAKQEVLIDMSKSLQPGAQTSSYSGSTTQAVIFTHIAGGTVDVLAADADNFYYYLDGGVYGDLRDYLTAEELASYEDQLIYVSGDDYAALTGEQMEAGTDERAETERQMQSSTDEQAEAESQTQSSEQDDAEAAALEAERIENFIRPDPEELEDPVPVGVMIQDTAYMQDIGVYEDTVVIVGIVASTKRAENAAAFINYLMTAPGLSETAE